MALLNEEEALYRREAPAFRVTDIRRNKARNVALLNEEAALYRREAKKGFGDDVPERVWAAAQKRKNGMSRREDRISSAHSFVLGLDGFEQSMQLYKGDYIRNEGGAQENFLLTNGAV